jgi:feruloyl esterase
MAHGVPLATTTDGESCGAAGAFFLDVGISSTHHIARFWHLHESLVEIPRAAAPVSITAQIPTDRAFVIAGAAAEGSHSAAEALLPGGEEGQTRFPLDPNVVIAAAFKAAGLPVPEFPTTAAPDAKPRVAPGPIIAAALKAAGLVQG